MNGKEWFEFDYTEDASFKTYRFYEIYIGRLDEHQEPDLDVGDEYGSENIIIVEVTKYNTIMILTPYGFYTTSDWKIKVSESTNHPKFFDHWNVFRFEFLQWVFVREEKRAA